MRWLITKFLNHFDKRRRQIDMDTLWTSMKEQAPDIETARRAFTVHALSDNAWMRYYTEEQLASFINNLT